MKPIDLLLITWVVVTPFISSACLRIEEEPDKALTPIEEYELGQIEEEYVRDDLNETGYRIRKSELESQQNIVF